MKSSPYFIVIFDDGMGASWPMGWDSDCIGALCAIHPPVLFKTRIDARRAILISTRFAKLQSAQGKPFNTDFTDGIKYVKVVPCVEASTQSQPTKQ